MKIYTKTGDNGTTGLYGGTRVPKYHLRVETYGTVDELNSHIGLIRDQEISKKIKIDLLKIKNYLFTLGSMLATPEEKEILKNGEKRLNIVTIDKDSIEFLEQSIDLMNLDLPAMTHFTLPGGHSTVSYCHIARCVCRRTERLAVQLAETSSIESTIIMYLNRLSDYLFTLARKLTYDLNVEEIQWIPSKNK
jgi:cob(I)alamin adenosyltransferase